MRRLTLATCALNTTPLAWADNLAAVRQGLVQAREAGASLVCFPELCLTGYGCEDAFFSENTTTRAWQSLMALLPDTQGLVVAVGLPVLYENSLYNCVALVANGTLMALVAKQKLAGDGLHYEPRWFRPWPTGERGTVYYPGPDGRRQMVLIGDMLVEVDGLRIGVEVCEDAWNGDRPAVGFFRENVDIILSPSASHFAFDKHRTRRALVVESSRSFGCVYLYCNLVGNEAGRNIYDGESLIALNGRLYAENQRLRLAPVQLTTATLDIDLHRLAKRRNTNFRAQAHAQHEAIPCANGFRWPSSTAPLTPEHPDHSTDPVADKAQQFYRAVTLGLYDYMRKTRSRGFVLSLSGGADSSACAVLATHALRRATHELPEATLTEHLGYMGLRTADDVRRHPWLVCVYQATANSGHSTRQSAQQLAQDLGAQFRVWQVQTLLEGYHQLAEDALGRKLDWHTDDLALQNIQARVRAPGVWLLANVLGALLLTTSNRSEGSVGYATMDGDTSGGLAPIAGVDKAYLIEWLRWAEYALPQPGLAAVNALEPTAELRPAAAAQTDEKDLMPYPLLNRIEQCAVRDSLSPADTFRHLRGQVPYADVDLKRYITRFYGLWARNQWKRERIAPSFHLDDHNVDPRSWCRFPILNGGYAAELAELELL